MLAGYAIAIWNGRVLKKHGLGTTVIYVALAVGGWLLTVWILANLEPAHTVTQPQLFWEPGFAVPVALGLSFLLVAIPYNRDTLSVNQWTWNHPARRLVFTVGRTGLGLRYRSFSGAGGELFGTPPPDEPWVSIPVLPVAVVLISLAIGLATLAIGNLFAPIAYHSHHAHLV